jgi:hypothetical protein
MQMDLWEPGNGSAKDFLNAGLDCRGETVSPSQPNPAVIQRI